MNSIMVVVVGILQITLLDLVLSADNIGVIALATKKLSPNYAKKASVLGIAGAIGLRILFACLITYIMMIQWLPIKLVGGLLLVKITWDLIKPSKEEEHNSVKSKDRFMGAVFSIIIADLSMSIDNILAIGASANGNVMLIVFGIMLNIPILFFGSNIVGILMRKFSIVMYIGGAVLAHTSIKMIFEDKLIMQYAEHNIAAILPWIAAVITLIYGFYMVNKEKKGKILAIEKHKKVG